MGYYQELLLYASRFRPAIKLKTSTTATYNEVFGATITLSGLSSGDFVLAVLTDDDGDSIPLTAGWTSIANNTGTASVRAAYIFATGGSVSYTIPTGTDIDGSAVLAAFTGVNTTTPLDVSVTKEAAGNTTSITPDPITTVSDNCMILTSLGIEDGDLTVTDPSGYTRIAKAAGGGFFNLKPSVTVLSFINQIKSGTETPGAFSWSGNRDSRTITFALRPDTVAGGSPTPTPTVTPTPTITPTITPTPTVTPTVTPSPAGASSIAFVTSGTQIVSSGGQTLNITGIQADDIVILTGTSDSQQVNLPAGFTQLEDDEGTANPGGVAGYDFATGTSMNITLSAQGGSGANQIIYTYQVFRNVNTTTPIEGSSQNHNNGSSRINLPSVTTTVADCMIVVYGMVDDDGYSSLTLPSGYTQGVFDATGVGLNSNYSTVVGGYKLESSTGTISPGTIFLTENDGRDGYTIALKPA